MRWWLDSPATASRRVGSVGTSTALSWLIAWPRDWISVLASLNMRIISTGSWSVLAAMVAAQTARLGGGLGVEGVCLAVSAAVALSSPLISTTSIPAASR
jgi:hypothetical protein